MKRLFPLLLVLLVLLAACRPTSPSPTASLSQNLEVHFIDVGQGDSIFVKAPDGKTMLIDGGERGSGTLEYLKGRGVKQIDVMVATHPHDDHIGGLTEILRQMTVKEVWLNGDSTTTPTFSQFLQAIDGSGAKFNEAQRGNSISLGNLRFDVLNPRPSLPDDINGNSTVLRLEYGKVSFLFTGDATKEAESNMLNANENVRAKVLKVGHHGSSGSSSAAFLKAVAPEVAVYSAGKNNSYGHPAPVIISRLLSMGVKIFGTDVNGTVVVSSDGQTYQVTTQR